jgi:hypothetical protein
MNDQLPTAAGGCSTRAKMFWADIPSPVSHLEGDREFADSPLEGDGFELLVPRHESPRFPKHPGMIVAPTV